MMRVTALRIEETLEETLGVLVLDGELFCYTLELPWRRNRNDISCIPEGLYMAKRIVSEKHGETYLILHVPNRTEILLGHVGNTHIDTTGCILLGTWPGRWEGRRAVMASEQAVKAFREATKGEEILTLGIMSVKP